MTHSYKPPKVLREWTLDVPGGELSQLFVFDNLTVCSAVGRYAHSSGSRTCSWSEFLAGTLNGVVKDKMGSSVLGEALTFIQGASRA